LCIRRWSGLRAVIMFFAVTHTKTAVPV